MASSLCFQSNPKWTQFSEFVAMNSMLQSIIYISLYRIIWTSDTGQTLIRLPIMPACENLFVFRLRTARYRDHNPFTDNFISCTPPCVDLSIYSASFFFRGTTFAYPHFFMLFPKAIQAMFIFNCMGHWSLGQPRGGTDGYKFNSSFFCVRIFLRKISIIELINYTG